MVADVADLADAHAGTHHAGANFHDAGATMIFVGITIEHKETPLDQHIAVLLHIATYSHYIDDTYEYTCSHHQPRTGLGEDAAASRRQRSSRLLQHTRALAVAAMQCKG